MTPRIRLLTDYAEFEQCIDFQRLIWGQNFTETVPAALLWVAQRTGGIVAAAFDEADQMTGFVFGVTGYVDGTPVHWSDMLGVHPRARGLGLGQALKRFQRDRLLERGVQHVNWTFDPLESRNAYLNFARLGITASEYIPDCYGRSSSPLHVGMDTDRLVATWELASPRVRSRMEGQHAPVAAGAIADLPLINAGDEPRLDLSAPRLRLRIPGDIQALKQEDRRRAAAWQKTVRQAFTTYFERGYRAVELVRESPATSCYILERATP